MNDRSAGVAVGVALTGHLLLLGLLSLAWGQQKPRAWPEPTPLEVSLVTEVAPEAQAPPAPEPPAPSIAPDQGAPEDAAPPPAPETEPAKPPPPEPTPPEPTPPKPTPAKQAPAQPVTKPAPPKPAAKPAPVPKPAAVKPAPAKSTPKAAAKTAANAPARPRSDRLAGLSLGSGANPAASATRPRGARLGDDFLKGLSADAPRRPASAAAPGAKPGPYPTASIVQAIARQIQPCADRQVNPGPGANRIVTILNIRLNPDGSLAATPTRQRQSGVNDENERYAQRVVDLGVAAFKGCSPLKLPSEYYQTASGGWNNINYQWQLR